MGTYPGVGACLGHYGMYFRKITDRSVKLEAMLYCTEIFEGTFAHASKGKVICICKN